MVYFCQLPHDLGDFFLAVPSRYISGLSVTENMSPLPPKTSAVHPQNSLFTFYLQADCLVIILSAVLVDFPSYSIGQNDTDVCEVDYRLHPSPSTSTFATTTPSSASISNRTRSLVRYPVITFQSPRVKIPS